MSRLLSSLFRGGSVELQHNVRTITGAFFTTSSQNNSATSSTLSNPSPTTEFPHRPEDLKTSQTRVQSTPKTQKVEDPKQQTHEKRTRAAKKAADKEEHAHMRPLQDHPTDEILHVSSNAEEAGKIEAFLNEDVAAEADWRRATEPDKEAEPVFTNEKPHTRDKSTFPDSDSSSGM